MASSETSFGYVDVTFEGQTLQMRTDQLTTHSLSIAFRLIPDTIVLISQCGTVAIPCDGVFHDVDTSMSWNVEGDKATAGARVGPIAPKPEQRWKPKNYPPSRPSTSTSSGNASNGRQVSNHICVVWDR